MCIKWGLDRIILVVMQEISIVELEPVSKKTMVMNIVMQLM